MLELDKIYPKKTEKESANANPIAAETRQNWTMASIHNGAKISYEFAILSLYLWSFTKFLFCHKLFFLTDVTHYWVFGCPMPITYSVCCVFVELADKLYNP